MTQQPDPSSGGNGNTMPWPEACSVEIRDLRHRYDGSREALKGISLAIRPGEHVLLAGRSGAGKSTLGLHLNGILSADAGEVRIDGRKVEKSNLTWVRSRVGIVFQDPDDQLFTPSVGEDVQFGPLNQGLTAKQSMARMEAALAVVRLEGFETRLNHELSHGEKRRAALATVLAMRPGLIVFDEPFANLDPSMVQHLAEIIAELPVTVLLISHEILPALGCCHRMVVMGDGVIDADGEAMEVARDRELLARHGLDFYFYDKVWQELRQRAES
ncbi:MAG TPA: ABC transporter ATP-binding protein [Bryobacteraceae bacterium]|nr:ABC transporter ATP-binding protein [Bryobacteraceae bacterium]HPT28717.1 ABC transporter ATP-binding protein [Bryobacteraceae bacterium]